MLSITSHAPILACICTQFETLRDVLHLALCSRTLHAQVDRLMPELRVVRELPVMAGWEWPMRIAALLRQERPLHPLVWRHMYERALGLGRIVHPALIEDHLGWLAERLLGNAPHLLQILVADVGRWKRAGAVTHDAMVVVMPEILVLWSKIALQAIRIGSEDWLCRASKPLADYAKDSSGFDDDWWLATSNPYAHAYTIWRNYNRWYLRVFLEDVATELGRVNEKSFE